MQLAGNPTVIPSYGVLLLLSELDLDVLPPRYSGSSPGQRHPLPTSFFREENKISYALAVLMHNYGLVGTGFSPESFHRRLSSTAAFYKTHKPLLSAPVLLTTKDLLPLNLYGCRKMMLD